MKSQLIFKIKMAQNSKNLRLNCHTSFEFQTRNYNNNYKLGITMAFKITRFNNKDVTETRNVIPSLEFKTCMTIKS